MKTEPRVVGIGDAHAVVVPDWNSYYSLLGMYCLGGKADMARSNTPGAIRKGADLYILCDDAPRAYEMLETLARSPFDVSCSISVARNAIYGSVATDLEEQGHAVASDSAGKACDDRRIKAMFPPPAGCDVDIRWNAKDMVHRVRHMSTRRDGSVSSENVVLRRGPDWHKRLTGAYRRFSGGKAASGVPVPACDAHVASYLSRLDAHAATALAAWLEELVDRGVDGHGDHPTLTISGESIRDPGELTSIAIKGRNGSHLLSATCEYHGGTTIQNRVLRVRATMPDTMVVALIGREASILWGADDLSSVRVRRSAPGKAKPGFHAFDLDVDAVAVPVPAPSPNIPDEIAAAEELAYDRFANLHVEPLVTLMLRDLPPSVRLHVYRTLTSADMVDIDVSPWVTGASHPLTLRQDRGFVRYLASGQYASVREGLKL